MPHTDSILARPPAFSCTASHGGLDAAWVNVVGELDITTAPELERTLRESQQLAHLTVLDLRVLLMTGRLPESYIAPEHLLDLRARVRLGHALVDQRGEWQ